VSADSYPRITTELRERPRRWLVTGAAGFIGSHLVERLLALGQEVVGMDDFSTGHRENLALVERSVGSAFARFRLVEADIRDADACRAAMDGVELVLHQAALGSVPLSIEDPRRSHSVNVDGFANVALAAVHAKVKGFVYASSSSVYGDSDAIPAREGSEGRPLSPYAASKRMNEVFAAACVSSFELPAVGLRYFNVVGARQDPHGAYAAVVPRWLASLARGEAVSIYGDGLTSRDFCPVDNVVQINLLAALAPSAAWGRAYNVGLGAQTTLNELYAVLRDGLAAKGAPCAGLDPKYEPFRAGDLRHSVADISLGQEALGFRPSTSLADGLSAAMEHALRG
jgi:UDP-N-acetylglucosamine/UDP-N-acetylgalactosamine 4-epimerase